MPGAKYQKMLDQIERAYPAEEYPEVGDALDELRDAMEGDAEEPELPMDFADEEPPMDDEFPEDEESPEDEEDDFYV